MGNNTVLYKQVSKLVSDPLRTHRYVDKPPFTPPHKRCTAAAQPTLQAERPVKPGMSTALLPA